MAHKGRNKKGQFVGGRGAGATTRARSATRAKPVTIRETITVKPATVRSGGASVKRGKSGRYGGGGKRSLMGSLSKERGPLIVMSAGVGWLDASMARYGKLTPELLAAKGTLGAKAAGVIKQIPRIGPFGWKAVVVGIAYVVHRNNRRNRWADRIATVFLQAEGYTYGFNYGMTDTQIFETTAKISGNGPAAAGGTFPAS